MEEKAMQPPSTQKISSLAFRASFISALVIFLSLGALWGLISWAHWNQEIKEIEERYLRAQKEIISQAMQQAIGIIEHQRSEGVSQESVLELLHAMGNIRDENGYIFVVDSKGDILMGVEGIYGATPPNTNEIILSGGNTLHDLFEDALSTNPKGAFVQYFWNKRGESLPTPKISYITPYEPWSWIIGSGIHVDDLEHHIKQKRQERLEKLQEELLRFILLSLILFGFIVLFSRFLQKKSDKEIFTLLEELKGLAREHKEINLSKIEFEELKELASLINQMMRLEIEGRRREEGLNATLKRYLGIIDKYVIASSTDLEGRITNASEAFCQISGYSKEELLGQPHSIIRHPDTPDSLFQELWGTISQDKPWHGEIKNRKKNGDFYWVEMNIEILRDAKGEKIGYTAIRQDITDKKRIEELSITDDMTKLYNRRFFNQTIGKELRRASRGGWPIHLAILDIDRFKQYNDRYGHQAGDMALITVARVMKESLHRSGDYAFRMGGEEFGILLSAIPSKEAFTLLDSIRVRIESLKIPHEGNQSSSYLTISFGLFTCPNALQCTPDLMYKMADQALYEAKESGRNKGVISPLPL
ncbi:MAG TPA: GGDEF domain-containing protein [Helicobacter sp.]|nr:GGDEF domain-containing protein [Helicobacter sp.]